MNIWQQTASLSRETATPPQGRGSRAFTLHPAALHEIYANRSSDGVAMCGLALVLASTAAQARSALWIRHEASTREAGGFYAEGIAELGFDPSRLLLVKARDVQSALQAALEGARSASIGAVITELWGEASTYDLTASRRLGFAAKTSGVTVLVARIAASPCPSAAQTRWQIRALPSRALAANAPGLPAFELTLLRARNGEEGSRYSEGRHYSEGQRYQLEWDRDANQFISLSHDENATGAKPAPLSGAVVALSSHGQGASFPSRRAG